MRDWRREREEELIWKCFAWIEFVWGGYLYNDDDNDDDELCATS